MSIGGLINEFTRKEIGNSNSCGSGSKEKDRVSAGRRSEAVIGSDEFHLGLETKIPPNHLLLVGG